MFHGSEDESNGALICCNDEGVAVDFSKILNKNELEIAIGIKQSHDLSLAAVEKAFDYCGGDYAKFQSSQCFKFLLHNTKNEVALDYDSKLKPRGLTGNQLRFSTPNMLIEKYKGDDSLIDNLTRMRVAMQKQFSRKIEQQREILANEWVCQYSSLNFIRK